LNKNTDKKYGTLFVIATPIGNLKDITFRAVETLEMVDWIGCEDTRHSVHLLRHYGVNKPLISVHDHNEQQRKIQLLEKLQSGENGALISDAGTPLISDPGYHLVTFLRENEIDVVPIPGASALTTSLSAAGMPTDKFSFEGFLPAKTQKKLNALALLKTETRTMVFYESPHRFMETLKALEEVFGADRKLTVAKELTKQFERFVTGSISEVIITFTENTDWQRGEFALIVEGGVKLVEEKNYENLLAILIKQNLPVKQISEIIFAQYGVKKKVIYQQVLDLKGY
jgi:16S rRNA (cytidine1402-2'-O)-methyltransferase